MSPRQLAIVAALERGACSTTDLGRAAGFRRPSAQSRAYVAATVWRLQKAGYLIANRNRRGSHKLARYELRGVTCARCGAVIASDHRRDALCSPCQRTIAETEMVTA